MAGHYEINPWKSLNGAISRILNGPCAQNRDFSRGLRLFWPLKWHERQRGPFWGQKSRGCGVTKLGYLTAGRSVSRYRISLTASASTGITFSHQLVQAKVNPHHSFTCNPKWLPISEVGEWNARYWCISTQKYVVHPNSWALSIRRRVALYVMSICQPVNFSQLTINMTSCRRSQGHPENFILTQ